MRNKAQHDDEQNEPNMSQIVHKGLVSAAMPSQGHDVGVNMAVATKRILWYSGSHDVLSVILRCRRERESTSTSHWDGL